MSRARDLIVERSDAEREQPAVGDSSPKSWSHPAARTKSDVRFVGVATRVRLSLRGLMSCCSTRSGNGVEVIFSTAYASSWKAMLDGESLGKREHGEHGTNGLGSRAWLETGSAAFDGLKVSQLSGTRKSRRVVANAQICKGIYRDESPVWCSNSGPNLTISSHSTHKTRQTSEGDLPPVGIIHWVSARQMRNLRHEFGHGLIPILVSKLCQDGVDGEELGNTVGPENGVRANVRRLCAVADDGGRVVRRIDGLLSTSRVDLNCEGCRSSRDLATAEGVGQALAEGGRGRDEGRGISTCRRRTRWSQERAVLRGTDAGESSQEEA